MKQFLFSDSFNYKRENFPAMFSYFEHQNINLEFDESDFDVLKKKWGECDDYEFNHIYDLYNPSTDEAEYRTYNLNTIIKDEVFFFIANMPEFRDDLNLACLDMPFGFLKEHNFQYYRKFLAIARFWVDYWEQKVTSSSFDAGITFGGSTIFSKAFLAVLQKKS